jgi:hypothetical protein
MGIQKNSARLRGRLLRSGQTELLKRNARAGKMVEIRRAWASNQSQCGQIKHRNFELSGEYDTKSVSGEESPARVHSRNC